MSTTDTESKLGVQRIQPAYRQVADQLRSLILSGELQPGSRLPNETDLSNLFGVSRSTVREALRVLSSQGMLSTTRGVGGGSFVAHPDPEQITRYLETSLGLLSGTDEVSVRELTEVREMLEVPATALAAVRRSDDDLRALRVILEREQAVHASSDGYEEHRQFHQMILQASGNALLPVLTRPLFVTLRTRFLRDQAPAPFWDEVENDHAAIYERIADGDADAAADAMRDHLSSLARTYEQIDRRKAAAAVVPDTTSG
jgi:GntR family transcriptional regulator, transcriptional repressor for pyruvate dehydrogenase complex